MSNESVKLGFMKDGVAVCINLVYFIPNKDFDLYAEASKFKWEVPEENWSNFALHLTSAGFGSMFSYVPDTDINPPGPAVARYTLVDKALTRVTESIPYAQCVEIADVDKHEAERVFQMDMHSPARMGIRKLLEIWPNADKYLTAQRLAYVATALQNERINTEVTTIVNNIATLEAGDMDIVSLAKRLGEVAEGKHAMRRTREAVESEGYSISGHTGETDDDPNILYTSGVSNEFGIELFCRAKIPVDRMAPILVYSAKLVMQGFSIEAINNRLKEEDEFKLHRPRLTLCRNEKIEDIFIYRVNDKFEMYRLMLDV